MDATLLLTPNYEVQRVRQLRLRQQQEHGVAWRWAWTARTTGTVSPLPRMSRSPAVRRFQDVLSLQRPAGLLDRSRAEPERVHRHLRIQVEAGTAGPRMEFRRDWSDQPVFPHRERHDQRPNNGKRGDHLGIHSETVTERWNEAAGGFFIPSSYGQAATIEKHHRRAGPRTE